MPSIFLILWLIGTITDAHPHTAPRLSNARGASKHEGHAGYAALNIVTPLNNPMLRAQMLRHLTRLASKGTERQGDGGNYAIAARAASPSCAGQDEPSL